MMSQPNSNYTTNPDPTQAYGGGQPNLTTNPNSTQAYGVGQPNFTPGMNSQPTSTLTVLKTGLKEIYNEIKADINAESATTRQQTQTPGMMSQPTSNYTTNPYPTQAYGSGQPNIMTNPDATYAIYGVRQPNMDVEHVPTQTVWSRC